MDEQDKTIKLGDDDDDQFLSNVKTMSNPMDSMGLPPILDRNQFINFQSDITVHCAKCEGRIPFPLLRQHQNWHARVNTLIRLREIVRNDPGISQLGNVGIACLLHLQYYEHGLLKPDAENGELLEQLPKAPLVTLRYIDGAKYTFGTKFLSRQNQGDFVYLNINDRDFYPPGPTPVVPNEDNYFQLECKDGKIWLSNRVEGFDCINTVISVNGVALGTDDEEGSCRVKELALGDTVTISVTGVGKECRFLDFIFKAITATIVSIPRNEISSPHDALDGTPIDNPLIVSRILQNLPTELIKTLRPLSHMWNTEGLKLLRHRAIVTIFKQSEEIEDSSDILNQISHFAHSQLSELQFPHWKFEFPERHERQYEKQHSWMVKRDEFRKIAGHAKVLGDLEWVLQDPIFQPRIVKTLHYSGNVTSIPGLRRFETLMYGVRNTLQSLTLHFGELAGKPTPPRLEEMRGLQTLSLFVKMNPTCRENQLSPIKAFIIPIIHGAVNIQTLKMLKMSSKEIGAASQDLKMFVVEEIGRLQAECSEKFSHFCNLSFASNDWVDMKPLSSLRPNSLSKLELPDLHTRKAAYNRGPGVSNLRLALETHLHSLQELTLHFANRRGSEISIELPWSMPNLRSFSLFVFYKKTWAPTDLQFHVGARPEAGNGGRRGLFPFPALKKLTLRPVIASNFLGSDVSHDVGRLNWRQFHNVIQAFMAMAQDEDGNIASIPTVTSVDIPFSLNGKYHSVLDHLETLFPNASFPQELEMARQNRLWIPWAVRRNRERDNDDSEYTELDTDDSDNKSDSD